MHLLTPPFSPPSFTLAPFLRCRPLYEWKAEKIDLFLFSIASAPYDTTPPDTGIVSLQQADATSLTITHEGFTDKDSSMDHYEVTLGTYPGGTNIIGWTDINTDTTVTFNDMDTRRGLTGDCQPIWATVRAVNAELLSSYNTSMLWWDTKAPQVVDLRVFRTIDGLWGRFTCGQYAPDGTCERPLSRIFSNSSDALAARFQLLEPCPSTNISQAWFAVARPIEDTPSFDPELTGEFTDPVTNKTLLIINGFLSLLVYEWDDVGRAEQFDRKGEEYVVVNPTDMELRHGETYFITVKSINTVNLVQTFQSTPILVDVSVAPSSPQCARAHGLEPQRRPPCRPFLPLELL